jgi:RNA polymerase sigma factor (sigma-70 family)
VRIADAEIQTPPGITAFCRELYPRLVGALALDTGDAGLAEEIAQEALFRAYLRWPAVSAMASPAAWVFRVALNLRSSRIRRRRLERRAAGTGLRVVAAAPADPADVLAVREAVARLAPRQREAIVLRYFADLPVRDAAEAMGCREGTVKALTAQAIAALRHRLGPLPDEEAEEDAADA